MIQILNGRPNNLTPFQCCVEDGVNICRQPRCASLSGETLAMLVLPVWPAPRIWLRWHVRIDKLVALACRSGTGLLENMAAVANLLETGWRVLLCLSQLHLEGPAQKLQSAWKGGKKFASSIDPIARRAGPGQCHTAPSLTTKSTCAGLAHDSICTK